MGQRMKKRADVIEKLRISLPKGESSAIKMSELAEKLGVSERDVRALIAEARKQKDGAFFCATNSGYFIPEKPEEVFRCYKRVRAHGVSTIATMTTMRLWLLEHGYSTKDLDGKPRECVGQLELWDNLKRDGEGGDEPFKRN